MKKQFIYLATALLFVIGFTSCKKDYTCVCTVTTTGQYTDPATGSSSTTISSSSKKQAASICASADFTSSSGGITTRGKCVIR